MSKTDTLTLELLTQIRDGILQTNAWLKQLDQRLTTHLDTTTNARLAASEILVRETRDHTPDHGKRLEDHEQRLQALERRVS